MAEGRWEVGRHTPSCLLQAFATVHTHKLKPSPPSASSIAPPPTLLQLHIAKIYKHVETNKNKLANDGGNSRKELAIFQGRIDFPLVCYPATYLMPLQFPQSVLGLPPPLTYLETRKIGKEEVSLSPSESTSPLPGAKAMVNSMWPCKH